MDQKNDGIRISFSNLGKKFYHRWIFRGLDCEIKAPEKLVLIGRNGSGKSTLLRILSGQLTPTEGQITFFKGEQLVPIAQLYQYISWSAPYLDMYLDLTLQEHIDMHFRFKTCILDNPSDLIVTLQLEKHKDKKLRYYSSGMLQRAKVGITLFTQAPLLLLDEPTSNMDDQNAALMLDLIKTYSKDRLLILASNMSREFETIEKTIQLG